MKKLTLSTRQMMDAESGLARKLAFRPLVQGFRRTKKSEYETKVLDLISSELHLRLI